MKVNEIKKILVEEYAYTKDDFVGSNGKALTLPQLKKLLKEEEDKANKIETETESDLDDFDGEVIQGNTTVFMDDDLISVMAGINGTLVHKSPVGNGQYKFTGFGQQQRMPYKELKAINNLVRRTFEEGWIIILNKDLIKEFNLESYYENFLTPTKVDRILELPSDELRATIEKLPKSMKTTLIDSAKSRYNAGILDSRSIISVFEELYDVSFEDNLPIKDTNIKKI